MPISKLEMDMSISRNIYEGRSPHWFVSLAQKVATYALIPLALVAMFEAVVKNLIGINLINLGIVCINQVQKIHACPWN